MIGRLLELAVRQRLFIAAAGLVVALLGVFSFRDLTIDVFPDPSPALVQIYTEVEGMAPEEVERLVSFPVESAMFGLPRVERVRSSSTFGLSLVNVYFQDGTDIHWARSLVAPRLHEIQGRLPEQAGEPFLGPIATGLGMVYLYYLEGLDRPVMELRTLQDWLVKYELKSVPEVSDVLSIGGEVREYRIEVDPQALLAYDLTLSDLMDRVRAGNRNTGAGFITRGEQNLIVRGIGLISSLEDLQAVVLTVREGTPVRLADVARVEVLPAVRVGAASVDGRGEHVVGMVLKLFGANTARVIHNLEERMEVVNQALPEGVRLVPFYNQAAFIRACYSTVAWNLGAGILLVVLVLFLFMGDARSALVTVLVLPFSVLFTFIVMDRVGLAADLMSFGGLAIAIGLIADASIILVEDIHRHLAAGRSRLGAIGAAGAEVARPLVFAVLIIIIVFLPIFTLQGTEGVMFRPMGYTISTALAGSLIFALFIAPALAWFLLRPGGPTAEPPVVRILRDRFIPFFAACRRRRDRTLTLTGGLLLLGLVLLPLMGREYLPALNEGTIHLRVTADPNISLDASVAIAEEVERRLLALEDVTGVLTRVGRGDTGSHAHFMNDLEILLQLQPRRSWSRTRHVEALQEEIEARLADLPGLRISLTQPIQHNLDELLTGAKAQLAVRIYGEGFAELQQGAAAIAEVLESIPGAVDVQVEQSSGQNSIHIDLDRVRLARLGLAVDEVQTTIEAAIGGVTVGQVFEGDRRFDIFLRYAPAYRDSPDRVGALLVPLPSGGRIPLREVADIEVLEGPRLISRENSRRYQTVQCNVRGRDMGRFVEQARARVAAEVALPPGYTVHWGGQFELQERARRTFLIITPLTFVLVALLLFSFFGSVREVGIILINIPLALTGGLVALKLTGQYMSVPASIGFIAIFGIALEDGLVLMETLRRLRTEGRDLAAAVTEGVLLKLRPVLMTSLTTVFGVLPLLLARGPGAEIQRPLATVVVGGLVTSTLVTLVVLPIVYELLMGRRPPADRADAPDTTPVGSVAADSH
jgi:cobalt-zinc-cadmium resistance protein CzcA